MWKQGALVDITVTGLASCGEAVGRFDGRVVFVADGVPGDRLRVRLLKVKPDKAWGKTQEIVQASPQRVRHRCAIADKCGGCQWQSVSYAHQLEAKRDQVYQALRRIGRLDDPVVAPVVSSATFGYRNKVTYPLGLSENGDVQAGYYRKGSHQIVDMNQCPVQDPRLDTLLENVKLDIQSRDWPVGDERPQTGGLLHLSLRVGRRTGEILLTLVASCAHEQLVHIQQQAKEWMAMHPGLVGVCVNKYTDSGNAIFGSDTKCIAGRGYLFEEFAGLRFRVESTTFFQINTEQAERMIHVILEGLQLRGDETLIDAYCGIGTLTLPLAQNVPRGRVLGVDRQKAAIHAAKANALENKICNAEFKVWLSCTETHALDWSSLRQKGLY